MGKESSKRKQRSKGFVVVLLILIILVGVDYGLNGMEGSLVQGAKTYLMDYLEISEMSESEAATIEPESSNLVSKATNNYTSSRLEVYFYDVGQADCILFKLDDKIMLIDTGNAGDAALDDKIKDKINLTHELKRLGIEKIDILVATHPHEDHMGSLYKIIQMFEVEHLYINALLDESEQPQYYKRFVAALEDTDIHMISPTTLSEEEIKQEVEAYNAALMAEYEQQLEELKASGETDVVLEKPELMEYQSEDYIRVNDKISFGDALVTMIAPNSAEYSDTNDYSIVLMVEFEGVRLLLTGDAGKESEEEMIKFATEYGFDLDCDILKVGHHGSRTASTEEFISAVSPEYAIVMVAEENSYGLPDEDVLERLENHGAVIYQTKEHGDIKLIIDDGNFEFDFSYSHEVKEDG